MQKTLMEMLIEAGYPKEELNIRILDGDIQHKFGSFKEIV